MTVDGCSGSDGTQLLGGTGNSISNSSSVVDSSSSSSDGGACLVDSSGTGYTGYVVAAYLVRCHGHVGTDH